MGSNNLRTLVRAAVVLGTFGFAAMGLVYVIPAIYSAITSLSFYNTLLFYFGVGTVLGALTAIPIFIPRVRNTLFSTITELLSRFTWQSQDVLDSALVHKRFVNKSPLGKVQELNILLKDDGYYEIVVKAKNGDLLRSLRTSFSSIKNYLESDGYNAFSIKTSNMDIINFFLRSLANKDKHVEVLYKKYRSDFLDLRLAVGQFNTHFYLPSEIVEYQFKNANHGHGLMSVIKVTNTRSDNRDFKKFEVTLEPQGGICLSVETNSDSFRSALNQIGNFSRIPFYAKEFMVEMTVDQFCHFCKECKIEGYITRTTCKELKRFAKDNAIVDQQSYDFKQDDAEDHSAMEEDLSLLSNQELLEHINNNRKAKGEAQISESSLPEHFMCTIGATLMDDPVHDGIAPQRIEYTVMLNCLERKNEHPFTRRKLRERDLIHDRALQKEIRDHLLGLDKPKPAPEQDQAEPAPLAPVITPARKSKQKARKTVSAKAAQDGAHSRPQRSSQRRR